MLCMLLLTSHFHNLQSNLLFIVIFMQPYQTDRQTDKQTQKSKDRMLKRAKPNGVTEHKESPMDGKTR